MDGIETIEVPVEDDLAADLTELARLHAGGDRPRFVRLLLLKALRPEQFAAETMPAVQAPAA